MGVTVDYINQKPFNPGSVIQLTFERHWTLDAYVAVSQRAYHAQLDAMPHRVDVIADMSHSLQSSRYGIGILLTQAAIRLAPNAGRFIIAGACTATQAYLPILYRKHPRMARKLHAVATVDDALNYLLMERGLVPTPGL